MKLLEMRI